jgi:hypothetical protein
MPTLLPQKTDNSNPFALNDTAHEQLVADKTVNTANFAAPHDVPPAKIENFQQDQSKVIASAGGAMHEGAQTLIKTDDKFGDWINKRWRPMMSVIYMLTCFADFVAFPVLWSVLQAMTHGNVTSQWQPLTLQGAGLYHIAMGAVLGLSAYGRSQEKIAGKA